ncbi:MAG: MerR family transcriptional regulator [Deltaproteobacteria bacterium]|nr:MerR family transcriptional regulator [Deltaproteobacteria bacterium]
MSYTKKQISDISGLSLRLVQFYTEEKLILPEKTAKKGRGYVRKYSKRSLLDFLVIKELSNFGITKPKIKFFLEYIHTEPYIVSYIDESLYREGIEIFLQIVVMKDDEWVVKYTLHGNVSHKTPILTFDDHSAYDSCILINFGQIVRKAMHQ